MTITIDATVGGASSNSYCTRTEGDEYHEAHLYGADWYGADHLDKDKALAWATRLLDEHFEWDGYKQTTDQALRWPRSGTYDSDRHYIELDTLPQFLKNATAELARHLITKDRTADKASGLASVSVGAVAVAFDKTDRAGTMPDSVIAMLAPVGRYKGGGIARIARV